MVAPYPAGYQAVPLGGTVPSSLAQAADVGWVARLARAVSGLLEPVGGTIRFEGRPLPAAVRGRGAELRRRIQYIFQNPDGRVVFAIPYEGDFTLIGTTDRDYRGDPSMVTASPEEIAEGVSVLGSLVRAATPAAL